MTRNNPITLKNLETLNQQNKKQILFMSCRIKHFSHYRLLGTIRYATT